MIGSTAQQEPPYPPAIRPSHVTNSEATATDLSNPGWAIDANLLNGAGNVFNLVCKFVCTTPSARHTEWYGFEAGWIPRTLIIRWDASSAFFNMVTGSSGKVTTTLEYSVDGGSVWTPIYDVVSTNQSPQPNVLTHDDPITLTPDQDPSLVRVRAALTVQMTSCNNCPASPSQVNGSLYIRDIRIEVDRPTLKVTPNPVTRGQQAAFELKGAPGGTISNWRYASEHVGDIVRATSNQPTWPGYIADAGTATVTVVLKGVTYNPTRSLAVAARDFAMPSVGATPVTGRSFSCLGQTYSVPVPVTAGPHTLGIYCLELGPVRQSGYINDQGPNRDVRFVLNLTIGSTIYKCLINPDLDDTGCQFYTQQTGSYPADPMGFISGEQLKLNAIRHESGSTQSHYAQYLIANADPTKNIGVGVEGLLARGESTSEADFLATIDAVIAARRASISEATDQPEPYGAEYNAAGQFQGYVNYASYVGCHP
jgi:hypothetical protein